VRAVGCWWLTPVLQMLEQFGTFEFLRRRRGGPRNDASHIVDLALPELLAMAPVAVKAGSKVRDPCRGQGRAGGGEGEGAGGEEV
jgi:hypothetical protein